MLALAIMAFSPAHAVQSTFDTRDIVPVESNFGLYFPFGDAYNNRYQLWFSSDYLAAERGASIASISNFLYDSPDNAAWIGRASWNIEVWASSTATSYMGLYPTAASGGLDSSVLNQNLGSDAVKVFDGWVTLGSQGVTIKTSVNYTYNSGNLLLDYRFKQFGGGITGRDDTQFPASYNGPTFQIHDANDVVGEVVSNTNPAEGVYKPERDFSFPLSTALVFESSTSNVPEPDSLLLLLLGIVGLTGAARWYRR